MDFKSLIQKISSMDDAIELPKAPELPKSVQLDEDAQLRVLAGQTTVLTESELMEKAVSKSQQKAAGAALAAKRGEGKAKGASKEMAKMDTKELKKFAGTKHKGLPEKKKDESVSEAAIDDYLDKKGSENKEKSNDTRRKNSGSRYGGTKQKDDNEKDVKEAAIDDYLDKKKVDGDKDDSGRRKHSGSRYGGAGQKDDVEDEKPEAKKGRKTAKESVELDIEEFNETFSQMVEAAKKGSKPDFLDLDGDGDTKEPMKKAAADKKKGAVGKDVKEAADKTPSAADRKKSRDAQRSTAAKKARDAAARKGTDAEKPAAKKKTVKESVERKLSFKQMVKLVQESGGQQQIDPKDQELFAWAQRVARTKLGEDAKAEIYAGLVYERMGGRFQMYDVLSEGTMVKAKPVVINGKQVDLNSVEFSIYGSDTDQYEIEDARFVDGTPLSDREIQQLYRNETIIDMHQDELSQKVYSGGSGL